MEKSKRNDVFFMSITFLMIGILLFLIINFFSGFSILEKREIYASFIVSDKIGFDLNKTALTFGAISPGGNSQRYIEITNNLDKRIKVEIKSKGEISDFLRVSENDFFLEPGEMKEISFFIFIPKDINPKKYEGDVNIIFLKT